MSLKEKLAFHKKKIFMIGIPLATLLALCIAFGSYCGYYAIGNKALPGVKIGEVEVHGKTEAQLVNKLEKAEKDIRVTFTNCSDKKYSLAQMGYRLDAKATAKKALAYNESFTHYFRSLFKNYTVVPVYTTDGETLIKTSNELSKNYPKAVPAVEPTIKFDKDAKMFKTVDGKDGIGAQPESILNAAKSAISKEKDLNAKVEYGTIKPLTTKENAEKLNASANKLLKLAVNIKVNNQDFTADADTKASWIDIPLADSFKEPNYDLEKVKSWLKEINAQFNKKPENGLRYVTDKGDVLRVVKSPQNGLKTTNFEAISKSALESIRDSKSFTGILETSKVPADWDTKTLAKGAEFLPYPAEPGEKWIDVNLSNHTISAYVGANRVMGPELMVHGSGKHPTVVGTYKVIRKLRTDRMVGPDYDISGIPWVMYFYGGYAVHGDLGRNTHYGDGGGGYGSHGCINLPDSSAMRYYNWAPMGTPVVTHY